MIWACHYYKNTNRQTKIPKRDTLFDFLPDQQFHHVHLSTMSTMSNSNVIWGLTITSSQSDFRGLSVIQWKTGSVLGRTHIDYIYPWMERVKMSNCIVDCLLHVNIWILTNAGAECDDGTYFRYQIFPIPVPIPPKKNWKFPGLGYHTLCWGIHSCCNIMNVGSGW